MRITKFSFRNLRLFGDAEQCVHFSEKKNVIILLGDNGAGKTSLLHGIAVLLSQFFEPFPSIPVKQFSDDDVHLISSKRRADYLYADLKLQVPELNEDGACQVLEIKQYKKGNKACPSSDFTQIRGYAQKKKDAIDNEQQVVLPILAYYGTERGQIKAPERRRGFNSVFPRWAAYEKALEPATNFKRFFEWFERNENAELREQKQRHDLDYTMPVLNAVRLALSKMDANLRDPRVEYGPLRFVMDDYSKDPNHPTEIRIERMSDGYRIMIALIADIAARMAEANPSYEESGLEETLNTPGIVLIDEVDLHLHPMWQRKVICQLTTIFPNVQFVVSTHSPNVVLGDMENSQVIKLDQGEVDDTVNLLQYSNYDVSLLLLSRLFGLQNVRSDVFKRLADEEEQLLLKGHLDDSEIVRLRELGMMLGRYNSISNSQL